LDSAIGKAGSLTAVGEAGRQSSGNKFVRCFQEAGSVYGMKRRDRSMISVYCSLGLKKAIMKERGGKSEVAAVKFQRLE
jgi:hypothetical protein